MTNPSNPLFNLMTVVTPEHIAEFDEEILVAEAYLQRLKTLRQLVGDPEQPPVSPPIQQIETPVPQAKSLPVAKPAREEPPGDEDPIDRREREEAEEEAEDEALVQPKAKPAASEAPSKDDKRKEALKHLRDVGFATSGQIIRDVGIGPRWINEILNHKWFETFKQDGKMQWRLSIDGRNALKSQV